MNDSEKTQKARALIDQGIARRELAKMKSDVIEIRPLFKEAHDLLASLPSHQAVARELGRCYQHLGWIYMNVDMHEDAINHCKHALTVFESVPDSAWDQADCRETIAKCYGRLGNDAEARKWMEASFDKFIAAG